MQLELLIIWQKIILEEKMDDCIALVIMHDLLEDTLYGLWIGA